LRTSCCFPTEKKTRSIPPPDPGQPWNCLHILTTSGYVWLTWACPGRRPALQSKMSSWLNLSLEIFIEM
jgi:hypothetical protein